MDAPRLYFFIGYPGAGKTTLSDHIAKATGAVHIWADDERHKYFPEATHTEEESLKLYKILNERTKKLLEEGQSVIFDTNFNFYHDRQTMRRIAEEANAEPVLIWLDIPKDIARDRAVCSNVIRNGYKISMSEEEFDRISSKLEEPKGNEHYVKISSLNANFQEELKDLGIKPSH